ncbi:antitermination regulator [Intrasporangium oryzae NRRL B-24470]|uniref:Antitermination regulator n=1 Tax=Intrasporangium oryzae NRRL B-24470 TaxID=1386089 RepID=W9GC21_9MICO|nr:GAF and ANTAR domain-containing protein [Intrasporangium oryzae]EWT01404.1 antitermination regulator [Intrasporangium oryzae NRRL B-24470]
MSSQFPADPTTMAVFGELSALIYAGADATSIHEAVVKTAKSFVDGCDHASLLLRDHDQFRTAASTDEIARRIDQIEIEVGEGPCVDAIMDEGYQHDVDLTRGNTPWPRFTQRIVAETPVRSAIGYRLLIDGDKVGALNLFSDRPGGLTEASADAGAVIASFASVALMAVRARGEAETLRHGLESNREIGKAVGLLMASHHLTGDEAFDLLRRTSQDLNMKLTHVAAQVVEGQEAQLES